MRESIGTISLLNFIFVYIFILFAIIAGTLSYYRSYRVNNAIIRSIEKYEGYNKLSRTEIIEKLNTLSYERDGKTKCDSTRKNYYSNTEYKIGNLNNLDTYAEDGFCVYIYENDTLEKGHNSGGSLAESDAYNTYEVITYMNFHFPIVDSVMRIKTTAKSIRIYDFEKVHNVKNS